MKTSFWFQKRVVILVVLLIFVLLTAFSSTLPDGLEWTAKKLGFLQKEKPAMAAPLNDYSVSNSFSSQTNQIISAILGMLIVAGGVALIMTWSKKKRPNNET